jgi:anhydro-N-acetylmuramic acid kinase
MIKASYREVICMSKIYTSIGLMSGTSLDGIDVALIKTDGESFVERGPNMTCSYSPEQEARLRQALKDAFSLTDRAERPGSLATVEEELTHWHVGALEKFFESTAFDNSMIDVIGFHGQTVLHRPEQKLTVQLGLGQIIADTFLTPVVYDMRANDVASGGQGAPLVPAYHRALAKNAPVAFVNIGGVANVTYVGAEGELLAFDTGPGNALINDWIHKHTGAIRDEGGKIAMCGKISDLHLHQTLQHNFFSQQPPKSLDRNSFSAFNFDDLTLEDGAATLTAFTVRSIGAASNWFPSPVKSWIICGGGRHNAAIMQGLRASLKNVQSAEDVNLNGDSMEAEAWAYLAVRSLRGLPITFPGTTGVPNEMTGGLIV